MRVPIEKLEGIKKELNAILFSKGPVRYKNLYRMMFFVLEGMKNRLKKTKLTSREKIHINRSVKELILVVKALEENRLIIKKEAIA